MTPEEQPVRPPDDPSTGPSPDRRTERPPTPRKGTALRREDVVDLQEMVHWWREQRQRGESSPVPPPSASSFELPTPKAKRERHHFWIRQDLIKEVRKMAKSQGVSMGEIVNQALLLYIQTWKAKKATD